MLVKNCSSSMLTKSACLTGVDLAYEPYEAEGGLRFRLKPMSDGKRRPFERFPFWRTSAGYTGRGRTVCAVCWHGHREFFRNLFKIAPDARVWTALIRQARDRGLLDKSVRHWNAENFEDNFEPTGDLNVGPPIAPLTASKACHCYKREAFTIPSDLMTSECWSVQFGGLKACEHCDIRDTDECGGFLIRKTGMNEKGYVVPIRPGSVNLFGPRKEQS